MEYMSLAQAVGEAPMPDGYSFTYDDLADDMAAGDYDAEDMAATLQLVGQNDIHAREQALRDRIAGLELRLAEYENCEADYS
jgi:hypothetical protein